ncbi:MAG: ESPR-type extended signal peptide-containing protein, partial [Duodenibacillus sp.]
MNKAYKVVFNKLRGTMMVVNETTGFIQTKGAKTVIAAAAAAMLAGVSGAVIAADTVATVGENEHSTLKSALDSSSEGDTIVLVKDLSDQTGLSFGQTGASAEHAVKTTATKVTIDLNEHRYTVSKVPAAGSTGYESQGFHIEKATGSLAIKNGTIVFDSSDASSLRMGIQNYTDLTLDGVVVDATKLNGTYAMSNNHGNVVVKNSTIIAREGGVAFDVYYWPNNGYGDGVSVTVENSTVDGRIEVLSDGTVTNIGQTHNLIIDGGNLVANTYRLDGGKITTQGYTTISNVALSGNKARN